MSRGIHSRSMFLRILWKLLGASRGRLTLALVALASGAAVCSALLNVNLDAGRKLTQEFRTLGAVCDLLMPQDDEFNGAAAAGAPEDDGGAV